MACAYELSLRGTHASSFGGGKAGEHSADDDAGRPDVKDPKLAEMAEKALAHNVASTPTVCEVLFPDSIRRSGPCLDDIATFATAVEPAVTFTTLTKLGWTNGSVGRLGHPVPDRLPQPRLGRPRTSRLN
jgi:hypothetical protein